MNNLEPTKFNFVLKLSTRRKGTAKIPSNLRLRESKVLKFLHLYGLSAIRLLFQFLQATGLSVSIGICSILLSRQHGWLPSWSYLSVTVVALEFSQLESCYCESVYLVDSGHSSGSQQLWRLHCQFVLNLHHGIVHPG